MTTEAILAIIALFPAIVLGVYIYKKDKHEKEPWWLLALLFVSGIVITEIAALLEGVLISFTDTIFSGVAANPSAATVAKFYAYQATINFGCIALVEEGLKWIPLLILTKKSKHFNSLFDGVIYAVFVSLGFAAYENIMYVFSYGLETGIMRAITAVPGHVFFAISMGYSYSFYHIYAKAQKWENELRNSGFLPTNATLMEKSKKTYFTASIVVPVIIHGLYDFMLSVDSALWICVFYIFLIAMYVFAFRTVNRFSKIDTNDNSFAAGIFISRYPQAAQLFAPPAPPAPAENTVPENTTDTVNM